MIFDCRVSRNAASKVDRERCRQCTLADSLVTLTKSSLRILRLIAASLHGVALMRHVRIRTVALAP
jgi:hypothetical protein